MTEPQTEAGRADPLQPYWDRFDATVREPSIAAYEALTSDLLLELFTTRSDATAPLLARIAELEAGLKWAVGYAEYAGLGPDAAEQDPRQGAIDWQQYQSARSLLTPTQENPR